MKKFFMYLKIILMSSTFRQSAIRFVLVFMIVFCLVFVTSLLIIESRRNNSDAFQRNLRKVFAEPLTFDTNVIIEEDTLPKDTLHGDFVDDRNFWKGTALETHYTLPRRGRPTTDQAR